jgi:hypothetical protein
MLVFLGLLLLESRETLAGSREGQHGSSVAMICGHPDGGQLHVQMMRETPRMSLERREWHLEVIEGEVDRMTVGSREPSATRAWEGSRTDPSIPSDLGTS